MGLISRVSSRTYSCKMTENFKMFCKMLDRAYDEHTTGKTSADYCPFETANSQLQTMQLIMSFLNPNRRDQSMFVSKLHPDDHADLDEAIENFVACVQEVLTEEITGKDAERVTDQLVDLIKTPKTDKACLKVLEHIFTYCKENSGLRKFEDFDRFWTAVYDLACTHKPSFRDKLNKS